MQALNLIASCLYSPEEEVPQLTFPSSLSRQHCAPLLDSQFFAALSLNRMAKTMLISDSLSLIFCLIIGHPYRYLIFKDSYNQASNQESTVVP